MNLKNTVHLAWTELRRNLWFILIFWLQISLLPVMELAFLVAGLLTARIAYTDHLTRSTAQWKVRPLSLADWIGSRLLLLFVIFLIPVAIQQGISLHLTGFSASATRWGVVEAVMLMLLVVSVIFVFCSLAETWTAIGIFMATFLGFAFIVSSIWSNSRLFEQAIYTYNGYDFLPAPMATWMEWGAILLAAAILFLVICRFRSRPVSIAAATLFYLALSILASWSDHRDRVYQPRMTEENIYLSSNPKAAYSHDQQQIYEDVVISGLPRGGFIDILSFDLLNEKKSFVSGNPTDGVAHNSTESLFIARDALIQSLPDEQRILLPNLNQIHQDARRESRNLAIKAAHESNSIAGVRTTGAAFQWVEIGDFPLSKGHYLLNEELSVEIRDLGSLASGPHSRSFKFTFIGCHLKLSPFINQKRRLNLRQGPSQVAIVAYHPRLQESIVLSIPHANRSSGNSETLFRFDQQFKKDATIYADPKWRLIWPEGDLASQWLEEARVTFYATQYLGRFHGSLELAEN